MSTFTKVLMATAIAFPMAQIAQAEGKVEGNHHWVSESEVGALKVLTDSLATKGFIWEDSAVGGLSGGRQRDPGAAHAPCRRQPAGHDAASGL